MLKVQGRTPRCPAHGLLRRPGCLAAALTALLLVVGLAAPLVTAQTGRPKAIVLAWDGVLPSVVNDLVARGRLPNLAKLIQGGAFADDVVSTIPSKTAVAFASIWTGAPPRITGISGNRIPRTPSAQFTILETRLGFSGAALRAEPLWNTAIRAGLKVLALHTPLGTEKTLGGVQVQGYNRASYHDGIISARSAKPKPAPGWSHMPPSNLAPLEISFTIQASSFYGLLIDDPEDPTVGYDTLIVSAERDAHRMEAQTQERRSQWARHGIVEQAESRSRPRRPRRRPTCAYSTLKVTAAITYSTSRRRRAITSRRRNWRKQLKAAAGAFVGNGASLLYQQGALGTTMAKGGDGSAEARYLETVTFVQQHFIKTARWALETQTWDLLLAYAPYPDEAEHVWRGYLDSTLPGHRSAIAARLKPLIEAAYQGCDELLGVFLSHRPANTIVALVSDHGMEGVSRWVAINRALQRSGLQVLDGQGRVDLQKTQAYYPSISNGYLLINSTERKNGIVSRAQRSDVVHEIQRALSSLRDGDRPVVASLTDARVIGAQLGIGGETGGDIYIELMPGYDFDSAITPGKLIAEREPIGNHGYDPLRPSMRTLDGVQRPGNRPWA